MILSEDGRGQAVAPCPLLRDKVRGSIRGQGNLSTECGAIAAKMRLNLGLYFRTEVAGSYTSINERKEYPSPGAK